MTLNPPPPAVDGPAVCRPPAAAGILWLGGRLREARDLDSLVLAAAALMQEVAPGTTIERCRQGQAARRAAALPDRTLRIPLPKCEVLVLTAPEEGGCHPMLVAGCELIAARVDALANESTLEQSVERLARSERVQRALYAIADQASAPGQDLTSMFRALHGVIGTLMYAENFLIALYDLASDSVRVPYVADRLGPAPVIERPGRPALEVASSNGWPLGAIDHSRVWHVIRSGKALMGSPDAIRRQVDGPLLAVGTEPMDWLGVPLLQGSRVTGCVVVQSYDDVHRYAEQDRDLLGYVARHIQTALERRFAHAELMRLVEDRTVALRKANRVLQEEVRQRERGERLQHALFAIAEQAGAAGRDLTPMFGAIQRIVGTLMYAENFYIVLCDTHDGIWFPYYADTVDPSLPIANAEGRLPLSAIEHSPTWYVIRRGQPLVGSLDAMGSRVGGPLRNIGTAPRYWLGAPLMHGREVVGCVAVQSYDQVHQYDEQDQALLIYVARQIQAALESRLAHAELERRVEERTVALRDANRVLQQEVLERQRGERLQAALFRIAELANGPISPGTFYAEVHRVVGDLLDARNFYIALLSCDGTELSFPYAANERGYTYRARKLSKGLTEYVMRTAQPLLVGEAGIAAMRASGDLLQPGSGASCWLGVPLVCAEQTVGVLAVEAYSTGQPFTRHDQELLTFVSWHVANALERIRAAESLRQAYTQLESRVEERTRALALANRDLRAQVTERERAEARLRYETLHDALTGLPNRGLLAQRLENALARYHEDSRHAFAVLYMDLDRFKVINDSEGHQVGDELLQQAGARIGACLKAEDVVARLGGDEFSVLLEGVGDIAHACGVAQRIIDALNVPFLIGGKELFSSTSVGVALAAPHYRTPDELLRDADSAMYRAKAAGRHCWAVFDHELRQQAVSLLEVENDLRRALPRDEFVPYYQPIVDLASGRVVGYEALMRWRHPQRGVLLPGSFLEVAEDINLSETIDWQIFTQVCRDANALAGPDGAFVAVNLSPRHFNNPQLDQRLLALLAAHAVPPTRLHVEVTERTLLEDTPAVKRSLRALRGAGIGISLDDFGTGYSSLSYLHQYPLQSLKIDRSFVANLGDGEGSSDALIRTILAMAESLSLQVIAEGVETELQRDLLRKLGCGRVQGFLYAQAQPFEDWIAEGPAKALPAGE